MTDLRRITRIGDNVIDGIEQSESSIDFPEQEKASVGGEPSTVEVRLDSAMSEGCKSHRVSATVCHSSGPLVLVV